MEITAPEPEMIGIPIQEFISASKLPVDIYVRLGGGRYVQVANAGEAVEVDRLLIYEKKKVDKIYVKKEDFASYVDQTLIIAGVTISRKDLDNRKKASFLSQVAVTINQEMQEVGFTVESFSHAKIVTRIAVDLVESKVDVRDLLEALNKSSNDMLAHSLGVCMVSVMIGQRLGWSQQTILEKLALGGLLHDLGMKDLPAEMIVKTYEEMSSDEKIMYEQHPAKGAEMLQALNIVTEDVIAIVQEHHENAIGQGFPRRLKNLRIHPLARVVGLADAYCEIAIKSPTSKKVRPASEAFKQLERTLAQFYSKELMNALREVIDFEKGIKKAA